MLTKLKAALDKYPLVYVLGLIFILSIYMLGGTQQSDFLQIITFASVSFGCYFFLTLPKTNFKQKVAIGIMARMGLIFLFPGLSDDIYRFVWDGRLIANGMNPYHYLPSSIVESGIPGLDHELLSKMNSPNYYTIYPVVSQFVYYLSTIWSDNLFFSSVFIKFILLGAELLTLSGVLRLLVYTKKSRYLSMLYWLNPLIIIEGIGNVHFEVLMICFLVWSIYYLFCKNNIRNAVVLFSLSVATKLLPLMFLPFLLFQMSRKAFVRFMIWLGICLVILFLPILPGIQIANFGESVDLYFQKFEFNASMYYLLRYIGKLISGYNLIHYIGPSLGVIALTLILRKAKMSETFSVERFIQFGFYSFVSYLFLATTIHPWYLSIPIVLGLFTRYRFVYVWSFMIFLTYINYSYDPYYENLWIVSVEYAIVFFTLLYELKRGYLISR